jgi:hypothetical protein
MALFSDVGGFATRTTVGSQSITGITDGATFQTFQPKVIIFFWTNQTSDGFNIDNGIGIGAASGATEEGAVWATALDASATSSTRKRQIDGCLTIVSNTGTLLIEADLTSFDADGFTLDFTTASGSAHIIRYLALGGDLTNAKVGRFAAITSGGPTQAVTGVGFQPDAALFFWVDENTAPPTSSTQAHIGMGAASGATSEGTAVYGNRNAVNPTQLARTLRTDRCIFGLTNPLAESCSADLTSFNADGFTLTWSTLPPVANIIFYVALKGARFKVGSETQRTSVGTKATTGVGFQPNACLFWGVNRVVGATIDTTSTDMGLSIGAMRSDGQSAAVFAGGQDATTPSDEDQSTVGNIALRHAANGATTAESIFSAYGADGFTLNWTVADATAREFLYLALGNALAVRPPRNPAINHQNPAIL